MRVGDLNYSTATDDAAPQTIPVGKSIAHEKYRPPHVYNDIGLLQLTRPVEITRYARPACLFTEPNILATEPLIATGWGRTEFYGPSSADLLQVTLEQFSIDQCAQSYKPSPQLPMGVEGDSQLCAGSRFEQKDTCNGDSGGPLQMIRHGNRNNNVQYNIVGVTSFGKGCGTIGVPGVYTRVSHYVDWIEESGAFED